MLPSFSSGRIIYWSLASLIAILAAIMLFGRLGHYALWDDETMVALVAKGVLRTGDTSILPDAHNIVAYRNGLLVRDLHDRSTPPLATYLTAASFSLFGQSPFAARLPFALFGLATLAFIAFWLRRAKMPPLYQLLIFMGMLGNISFILYSRQCRYYAISFFLTVVAAYLYANWAGRWKNLLYLSIVAAALFAANYLAYAALAVCLAADFLIWRRKEYAIKLSHILALVVPQILIVGPIASIWNPLATQFGSYVAKNSLGDRLTLFFWNLRDINACEFLVGALVLAAPIVAIVCRQPRLLRLTMALLVYVAFITLVSPQLLEITRFADVRYLIPIIPLCVVIEVETLLALTRRVPRVVIPLALVVFGTNLFQGGPVFGLGLRSTFASYIGELIRPPSDPFTAAGDWIGKNVKPGTSIFVTPDYMAYPLMFRQPEAVYAWQLSDPPPQQFANLPPIHVMGRTAPDYLIAFGPSVGGIVRSMQEWQKAGIHYRHIATIDHFWHDLYRPELFWRRFDEVRQYNPNAEAIYVFRREAFPQSLRDSATPPQ